MIAALSCLTIYILACVFSPPGWSPDSSKIALLVMPPGDDPNIFAIFTYDITTGKHVLLDKVKADGVLSAPSWSPDGKWIAYYRVEPSTLEESSPDPNMSMSMGESRGGDELFSEENKTLPPLLWEAVKGIWDESDSEKDLFAVKLIIVKPDGTERKVLRVMQFISNEAERKLLSLMQPQWSPDCTYLFYERLLGSMQLYYIGSLNITTGATHAHLFSSAGSFSLSPDSKWIASLLKNESKEYLLNIARVDGTMQKYFKLDLKINEEALLLGSKASWSHDSKHILIPAEEEYGIIDTETGNIEKYCYPDTEMAAWPTFSPDGRKVYYLAMYRIGDPNSTEEKIAISSIALKDKKVKVVTFLPKFEQAGQLSVSPNGKMVLLRCVVRDERGNKKPALLLWDGKTRKVIDIDKWLDEISEFRKKEQTTSIRTQDKKPRIK